MTGGLDASRLRDLLAGDGFVRRIEVLAVTSSTNDDARRLALEGAPSGTVVVADHQTAGRGRLGRSWFSPPGLGLYLSVLVRPVGPVEELSRWTLAASLAACQAGRRTCRRPVTIRWPNDVVYRGRKLAGILSELRTAESGAEALIVGAGFNVNHDAGDFPPELADVATSLRSLRGGDAQDRQALAADYLTALGSHFAALDAGRWEDIRKAWTALAPGSRGARVRVRRGPDGEPGPEGTTRGVDRTGALLVRMEDGGVLTLRSVDSVLPVEEGACS